MHPMNYTLLLGTFLTFGWSAVAQTTQPAADPAGPAAVVEDSPVDRLGERFTSLAAGISFRPPVGGVEKRRMGMGTDIVQYSSADERWALKVSHLIFDQPTRLLTAAEDPKAVKLEDAKPRAGVLDENIRQLRLQNSATQILRKDVINVGPNDAGIVVCRYGQGAQTWLRQQAFVQAGPRNYYVLDFTTPSGQSLTENSEQEDPTETMAVAIFRAMLDTVQVLDQRPVEKDNEQRLYRTRALQVGMAKRLQQAVQAEQYYRFLRNGKDVGWSYVAEAAVERDGRSGILVAAVSHGTYEAAASDASGAKTSGKPTPAIMDVASEMFFALDKSANETWITTTTVTQDGKKEEVTEIGQSLRRMKRVLDDKPGILEEPHDPRNPQFRIAELYTLDVTQTGKAGSRRIARDLPPFYLPQVVGSMLPRMLPLNEPKTYLFVTWVGAEQQLIYRYVDVEGERNVTFNGEQVRAIVIKDRIGLEGTPTYHYLTSGGQYLGNTTPASGLTAVAIDLNTLIKLYPDANTRRPRLLDLQKNNAE